MTELFDYVKGNRDFNGAANKGVIKYINNYKK